METYLYLDEFLRNARKDIENQRKRLNQMEKESSTIISTIIKVSELIKKTFPRIPGTRLIAQHSPTTYQIYIEKVLEDESTVQPFTEEESYLIINWFSSVFPKIEIQTQTYDDTNVTRYISLHEGNDIIMFWLNVRNMHPFNCKVVKTTWTSRSVVCPMEES